MVNGCAVIREGRTSSISSSVQRWLPMTIITTIVGWKPKAKKPRISSPWKGTYSLSGSVWQVNGKMATLHLSSNLPLFGYREQSEVPLARDHVRSRSDQSTDDNPAHASRTTSTKKGLLRKRIENSTLILRPDAERLFCKREGFGKKALGTILCIIYVPLVVIKNDKIGSLVPGLETGLSK
ncbi:unnamed protein product [Nesidiocoris tenuis]|uniref:Uncharacterized protein n=1 Tax=Nesidiocoris tenuis TaxID=355587 RepID=A0A6H5FXN7_9HEMI|nr:unnamed protein product [Nesidiocoris tenuis]